MSTFVPRLVLSAFLFCAPGRLLAVDPGSVTRVADQLLASGTTIGKVRDCKASNALTQFGDALQSTARTMKELEPMLVRLQRVDIRSLGTKHTDDQVWANLQSSMRFDEDVKKIDEAGKTLATTGPPRAITWMQGTKLLTDAGRSLSAYEDSGIGRHLGHAAEALENLRVAAQQRDQDACAESARLTEHMIALAGHCLLGLAARIEQRDAAVAIGLVLSDTARQLPAPPLMNLVSVLRVYNRTLEHEAVTFAKRADIARLADAPSAEASRFFSHAASLFDDIAFQLRERSSRINTAIGMLQATEPVSDCLRNAGRELRDITLVPPMKRTGAALFEAGRLLESNQPAAAARALDEAGQELLRVYETK